MNLQLFLDLVIVPTLTHLLPPKFDTPEARVMLLAIALQESSLEHRHQVGGPAHSWWQFEKGGGVRGVLRHRATHQHAEDAARLIGYPLHKHTDAEDEEIVFTAMEHNCFMACVMARLLLFTYPDPLPTDEAEGWKQYLATWRPGKPHPKRWPECWARAVSTVHQKES